MHLRKIKNSCAGSGAARCCVEGGGEVEKVQIDEQAPLMESPFDPTKINIETKTPSLDTLIRRIRDKTVQLDTESYFQRNPDLWDATKQSRLIASMLIQLPPPALYFDATDDCCRPVVDGLQRLSSIRNFVVYKTLKLTNLEFLMPFNGKTWNELPLNLQRAIDRKRKS